MSALTHTWETPLERVRFFPRQLIGADDLTSEQRYHRQRLRNHNRFVHGWGVVAGCDVRSLSAAQPWTVVVGAGYVLTPQGDEIMIAADATFDVSDCGLTSEDPCAFARPCPPITRRAKSSTRVYLAVRHLECEAQPVRVAPLGCGCDDAECEYSRIRDGYELACLTELPPTHAQSTVDCRELFASGGVLPLPEDATDPWVVLATITLPESETERISLIDLETDRRLLYPTWMLQRMVRCAAPQLGPAWHAVDSDVYHDSPNCKTGNNIEAANVRPGTGGRRLCEECARLDG